MALKGIRGGFEVALSGLRGGSEGSGVERGVWGSPAALPRGSLGIHGILGHPELGGNGNPRGDGVLLPPAPPEECEHSAAFGTHISGSLWNTGQGLVPPRDKLQMVPRSPGCIWDK